MKFSFVYIIAVLCSLQIHAQSAVKLSTDQFSFTEGPVWDGEDAVYFSDIRNKTIVKYTTSTNTFNTAFKVIEDGCNGLMFDENKDLLMCNIKSRKVSKWTVDGFQKQVLVSEYNGLKFNNPNDLCIDKKGGIYFTDPKLGKGKPNQPFNGIYYINPQGKLLLIDNKVVFPNGIIISKNGKKLFVDDSRGVNIYCYDIDKKTGMVSNKKVFTTITKPQDKNKSGADGMAIDTKGNLYVTSIDGVQVFDKKGRSLYTIAVEETATNCTFGGKDKNILFITASKNLYSFKTRVKGVQHPFDLK